MGRAAALTLALAAACAPSRPQLVVQISTDLALPAQVTSDATLSAAGSIDRVRVDVLGSDGAVQDAREFIKSLKDRTPETTFTIAVNGEAAVSVGFVLRHDVERVSAEIGYWLAEPFWGRGIATEALVAMTEYAMATHHLTRMYALPFAWNLASCRVLEKAGYTLEARLRRSAIKNGVITDQLQYAFVVPETAALTVDDRRPPGIPG